VHVLSCDVPRAVKTDGSFVGAVAGAVAVADVADGTADGADGAGAGVAEVGRRRAAAADAAAGVGARSKLICRPSTSDRHPTHVASQLVCAQARHPVLHALLPRIFSCTSLWHTCAICLVEQMALDGTGWHLMAIDELNGTRWQ